MYRIDRPLPRLLRLHVAMDAAYRHMEHSEELAREAMALLQEAEAYRRRVKTFQWFTPSPVAAPTPAPADPAETK